MVVVIEIDEMSNFELLEDGVRLDGTVLTFAELGTHDILIEREESR